MSLLNTGFDSEIDSLFDVDQNTYSSLSSTPDLSKGKAVARPSLSSPNSGSYMSGQSQQFSGPSFQYDSYRQQTGLPVGGLANTFALNQATGLQYNGNHHGFVMPTETLNVPLSNLDEFDFARHSSLDMSEMDYDVDSPSDPLPTMFYPSTSSNGKFVNPTALVSQDSSPTYTAPVQRMYPGMHTQQAAQIKAQQAQKQQETLRQQQQRQIQGQKPLPAAPQQKPQQQQQKDPHVEESISRLLHQMRQNSVASTEDDASTPTGDLPHIARMKKEEEDMDEDERLLASEEGKKLSSKERRQLRNKVSARAFRSRRKEYIGQLEGEVAAKAQEANDLRVENRQLMEENTRLSDLTRMLLSSQAFSGFLNELSQNGMPAPTTTAAPQTQQQQQPQSKPTRKDVNPNHSSRQAHNQQTQVGMTMIPESAVDFSMLETPNWNAVGMNSYQVCALTEVPEGPVIDTAVLSGKMLDFGTSTSSAPKDCPVMETSPILENKPTTELATTINEDVEFDEVAFALFVDGPTHTQSTISNPKPTPAALAPCKSVPPRFILTDAVSEAEAWSRLETVCSALDATCDQLSTFTSHLS